GQCRLGFASLNTPAEPQRKQHFYGVFWTAEQTSKQWERILLKIGLRCACCRLGGEQMVYKA
ncbi:hypothetical protein, partial [Sutterella wadsworthensis]|uniref:hypothetical protein n=1 Tax=Sutterella wadsworthensis TaxID=40545 RepID=UPI003AF955E9